MDIAMYRIREHLGLSGPQTTAMSDSVLGNETVPESMVASTRC